MKRWIYVAIVVLIGALSVVGYTVLPTQSKAQVAVEDTAVVRRGMLAQVVEATGSLTPASEVWLSFSSSGRVEEVLVEEGQVVEAGQPLARLEGDALTLQVAQAEAALAAAEAQLAQLAAPPRVEEVAAQEASLRATEAQLAAAAADRDRILAGVDEGQIAAAEAQVASATAQQESALDAHERTMECVDIDETFTLPDGSKKHIERTVCPLLGPMEEQARANLEAAEASLAAAQAQLDDLTAGADVDQVRAAEANVQTAAAQRDAAQAQLDLLLAGATDERIRAAQASMDDARAALEQAQLRLDEATLVAPMAGTVASLDVTPGEIVNANQAVVVLSDLAVLEVEINLDETDVADVTVDQEAVVSVDAFPGLEMVGQVTDIALVAQPQAGVVLYPVTVQLSPNASSIDAELASSIRAGMTADVSIVTASAENVLVVPLRAIHTEGEQTYQYEGKLSGAYVERLAGEAIERVEVQLGLMTNMQAEIAGGLEAGDVVVVVPGPAQDSGTQLPPMFEAIRGGE